VNRRRKEGTGEREWREEENREAREGKGEPHGHF